MSRSKRDPFLDWLEANIAPEATFGPNQIIPTTGAHVQFYVDDYTITGLLAQGKIVYDPEYGPRAKVYRPVGVVDAETVKAWL